MPRPHRLQSRLEILQREHEQIVQEIVNCRRELLHAHYESQHAYWEVDRQRYEEVLETYRTALLEMERREAEVLIEMDRWLRWSQQNVESSSFR